MANSERYITTIELNSEQAQNRLQKLIETVDNLKKKKNEALSKGEVFVDEAELKRATRELRQWKIQMEGVKAVLDDINGASMEDLSRALRKLRAQSKTALPGSDEFNEIQQGIMVIEDRMKQLKDEYRKNNEEAARLTQNAENLAKVLRNISGSSLNELLQAQKYLEENIGDASEEARKGWNENLKQVKARITEIKNEQQQVVHQIDKYDQEIKVASKDMATVERETKLVNRTLANLSTANVRDLEFSIKIINEQLREMPRGTAAFDQLQNQAKALRTELERVRFEGAAQQSLFNRTADFFNKIQGAAIAAVGAVTGLTFTVRRCVQAFADMDQEMEDVRKYTGQTTEQVHEMNEEFKKMDTRTSRERLNQLASDAGRLGITGKEAILDFVDAADKINVALGDDLGEGAVKNIGKLAMSFGTDKTMGLRGAMLATGSAVNELAQNSSSAASYLIDFTARVAGFGKQVGLSQAQLMGFAAVMDENMLQDEMAATAFGQLLVKMTTDIDTFAKITGMKVTEYKKMVTENINGAVLAVARSLKGRDMEEMGHVFDAMHLNGQRAIGVLSTLGQKVDDVAERQRIASEAFEQGTSIIEEFNVQNQTVQAGIDKAQKQFHDLTVELGEKLMPVARYGITTGSAMVKMLSALIEIGSKYKATLVMLTVAIAALVLKKEADVLITKAELFWNEKLVASCKKLWAALASNPYAAVAAGVMLLIGYIVDLTRKTKDQEDELDAINKLRVEAKKKIVDEKEELENLIAASKNDKLQLDERMKAIKRIQSIIPDYVTELDKETGAYKENKKALDDYLVSLARKYEIEGAKDRLKEIGKELADLNLQYNEAYENNEKAKQMQANQRSGGYNAAESQYLTVNAQGAAADLEKVNKAIEEKLEARRRIYAVYGVEIQKEAANTVADGTEEEEDNNNKGNKFGGGSDKEEKERQKRERAAHAALVKQDKEMQAWTKMKLADNLKAYSQGEIDYRTFVDRMDAITLRGYEERLKIWNEESDEYKKIVNEKESYNLKSVERQERLNSKEVEREHQNIMASLQSMQYDDEAGYLEALYQADIEYLQKKASLYREGSEERMEIEEEIQDREFQHQLDRQQRHEEMVEELREQYLNMGNERMKTIALNGLEELHQAQLISEEEYQRAKMAIQAQYATAQSPDQQTSQTASNMLTNAQNKVNENAQAEGTSYAAPIIGSIQQYQAVMEQLKVLYADDETNHAAYLEAKRQATAQFCADLGSQFQAAYSSVNQIMSAASQYFSAAQEYETAQVKKKYEKQIDAAGKNQKKVKKLQEKQAKEEAAIKNKYNAKAMKIQIAQALASTALAAINAYSSAAQVPLIGYILGPIAAAAAVAAGMIQVAAIKKQAQAQQEGYYSGGYTGGRQYRREAGVVHQGEFVANHEAVNNPSVRPMLDFIDRAQRNNTVGRLSADDVSRQLGQGGNTVVTPIVNVTNDNEELRDELSKSREVNEQLLDVIDNKGIKVDFPLDTFDREYKHFKILKER